MGNSNNHHLIHTLLMSIETRELSDIYSSIQSEFHNDNEIQVTPVSGDPPNQYEITFNIPCTVVDEQGEISVAAGHSVIISIPFGFPHFPPSCKPKNPIFHPDFDAAAVCISDFWQSDRTITDLIRHLARMLRGEVYSTENTFNENAARWFKENKDKLPFRSEREDEKISFEPQGPLTLEKTGQAESEILEELDFDDEFSFDDELENTIPKNWAKEPEGAGNEEVDTSQLLQLAQDKRYNQLERELSTTFRDVEFSDKDNLLRQTTEILAEAQALYEDAESFENATNTAKALECYQAVRSLVSDYPYIDDDIQRVEQSSALLQDLAAEDSHTPTDSETGTSKKDDIKAKDKDRKKSKKKEKEKGKTPAPFFDEGQQRHINIIPYVVAVGSLCIVGTLTYFYFSLSSQLTEARQYFSDCTTQFAAKNFRAAERSCNDALDTSRSIFLVHQDEVDDLKNSIRSILNSEEMRQGLLGNVLYNAKYISKSALAAHQSLQELKLEGDQFLKASSWDEAAAKYQKALEISKKLEDIQPDEMLDLEQKFKYSAFRAMLSIAEAHIVNQEWEAASNILHELQGQINALPPEHQTAYSNQISTLLARGRFTDLKGQADKLFSESDWSGAVTLFQKAAEAGRALSESEYDELEDIQQNILKAGLYQTINEANEAFSAGMWDNAIQLYQQAIEVLATHQNLVNVRDIDQNIRKLKSIILQSAIIRDRQAAEQKRAEGDNDGALDSLDKVIGTIKSSDFSQDPDFSEILKDTQRTRTIVQEQIFIDRQRLFLLTNYIDLFLENYPAATRDTLSLPIATFEKKLNGRYLFKLQCTESGRGRPLKLVMFYSYNPNTDTWSFYDESLP